MGRWILNMRQEAQEMPGNCNDYTKEYEGK